MNLESAIMKEWPESLTGSKLPGRFWRFHREKSRYFIFFPWQFSGAKPDASAMFNAMVCYSFWHPSETRVGPNNTCSQCLQISRRWPMRVISIESPIMANTTR